MPDNERSDNLPRYRYEAKITVVLAADGLHDAAWMQRQIADVVRDHTGERVLEVHGSILDLKHRPDLTGGFRHAR